MPNDIKRPVGRPKKPQPAPVLSQYNADEWQNVMVGLGGRGDKTVYTQFGDATMLNDDQLLQLYLAGGMGAKIINSVADDQTREWIYLKDDAKREVLNPVLENLHAELVFNTAIRFQRLYGGAIIIIGALDGRTIDQPLNEKGIRAIEYLKPIDRTCINVSECIYDEDPQSSMFGKILKYRVRYYVNNKQIDMFIHHTRVLEFKNDPLPSNGYTGVLQDILYWGTSSMQAVYEALKDMGSISQTTMNILLDFVTGTYKLKNLGQLLASANGEAGLVKRLQAIQASRSVINAIILDTDEDFSREYTTVAGLPELMDRYMLNLSGASNIPISRLYGRSPAGLNATGENDLRAYYDMVEANQRNRIAPPLRRLLALLCIWMKLPTETAFEFNSLFQLSEDEKAKIAKLEAETAEILARTELSYVEAGLRDGYEVAKEHGWEDEYEELEADPVPTVPPVGALPVVEPINDNTE